MFDILKRFGMMEFKSMTTPMQENMKTLSDYTLDPDLVGLTMYTQLIGSLMYLVNTSTHIFFAVNTLSQFMVDPRHAYWVVTKHVMRYMCDTIEFCLRYALLPKILI